MATAVVSNQQCLAGCTRLRDCGRIKTKRTWLWKRTHALLEGRAQVVSAGWLGGLWGLLAES